MIAMSKNNLHYIILFIQDSPAILVKEVSGAFKLQHFRRCSVVALMKIGHALIIPGAVNSN
jgi:hypothetical protein